MILGKREREKRKRKERKKKKRETNWISKCKRTFARSTEKTFKRLINGPFWARGRERTKRRKKEGRKKKKKERIGWTKEMGEKEKKIFLSFSDFFFHLSALNVITAKGVFRL